MKNLSSEETEPMGIFEEWIDICCVQSVDLRTLSAELYLNFCMWCEARHMVKSVLGKNQLSKELVEYGLKLCRGTGGVRMIEGIALLSKEEIMANNNGSMIPGYEMKDNFACISPDDSRLWLELFIMADRKSRELCEILQYMRNTGAKLVRNSTYGYIIRPVIGAFGWSSAAEYEKEKKYLSKYKAVVVELLQELAKGGKRI